MFVVKENVVDPKGDPGDSFDRALPGSVPVRSLAYLLRFDGANRVTPIARDLLPFKSNFLIGSDPSAWRTDVPNYGEVVYRNLYDGIDLVYRATENGVKYEFIVRTVADPGTIRISYEGIESLQREGGELVVRTGLGTVRDSAPYSHQGGGHEVSCRFVVRTRFSYGFDCAGWDMSKPLIIDPLIYSTFLGGGGRDLDAYIAVDSARNAFVAGVTSSIDFPTTPGSFETNLKGSDVFVTKLNAAGDSLIYSTLLGGNRSETAGGIAIDLAGNAFVTGGTNSTDFPVTVGAFDVSYNGGVRDAFVTKLSPAGDALVYSTFLGGSMDDAGYPIAVDLAGDAYVAGVTLSDGFPTTPGAFRTIRHAGFVTEGFVTKLDTTGRALVYSTFLGGARDDVVFSMAVDPSGEAFVVGDTGSTDFPVTARAFARVLSGREDAFVARLDAAGSALVYATYLGGSSDDSGHSIAVDSLGSAYVTGWTESIDFPSTPGAYDPTHNGGAGIRDAFVTKLDVLGSTLMYSTFLGGGDFDAGDSVVVDSFGDAYIVGSTWSADFPVTAGAVDTTFNGGTDAVVTELDAMGATLVYSTFLGGSSYDIGNSIANDSVGGLYIAGDTLSLDFPVTPGAYDVVGNGDWDAFVTRLAPVASFERPDLAVTSGDLSFDPPGPVPANTTVTVNATIHNTGNANASQVVVRFYDGPPPSSSQIGSDQRIPYIVRGGGTGFVSVAWPAAPLGPHSICVFADPDNRIPESDETNNVACRAIQVTPAPSPDLAVTTGDVQLAPAPPVANGTAVLVNAIVHNVGDASSPATAVRFYDGMPPAPQVGADQPLPPLAPGGTATVSIVWTATPPGSHDVCVVVDPDNVVPESNETNNTACVTASVLPPETRPDYVPVSPLPAATTRAGLSLPIALSVEVLNQGNATAGATTTLAFFNASTPSIPFATSPVPPLAPSETSARFTATWMSPATPGTHAVTADVDYGNDLLEWKETNDRYTWMIDVLAGPVTNLVVGQPNVTAAATYVTSATPLSFTIQDPSGTGIRNTTYRIDGEPWVNYTATGPFALAGEGAHLVEWSSEDLVGNVEAVANATLLVDNTPPLTTATIGPPTYAGSEAFVTSASAITLTATDGGATPVGVASAEYAVDGGTWTRYANAFTLAAEGRHLVDYRSTDRLGNVEGSHTFAVVVDDTPPSITRDVGAPRYQSSALYVSPASPIALSATDGGTIPVGLGSLEHRVGGGPWTPVASPLTLSGEDGPVTIDFRAADLLGNAANGSLAVVLDGTPPATTIAPGAGTHVAGTTFLLAATDAGSGVARTEYAVDGGAWIPYAGPFTVPAGDHVIAYRSTDRVDNREADRAIAVMIGGPPPAAANWKPLVAAAFAAVIAFAGAWASRKRPWKGAPGRRATLAAFAATALPFVVAEAATGVVSLLTGLLSIPPIVGAGTAVDLGILVGGVMLSVYRVRKWTPPK